MKTTNFTRVFLGILQNRRTEVRYFYDPARGDVFVSFTDLFGNIDHPFGTSWCPIVDLEPVPGAPVRPDMPMAIRTPLGIRYETTGGVLFINLAAVHLFIEEWHGDEWDHATRQARTLSAVNRLLGRRFLGWGR